MTQPLKFEVLQYSKRIVIGCAPDEQAGPPQEVVFDVIAELPCQPRLLMDVWDPDFDYCLLTDAVDDACAAPQVKILQEALAFDVVSRIFQKSNLVERVMVGTQKTERYKDTRSIGFKLELTRVEWQQLRADIDAELAKGSNKS